MTALTVGDKLHNLIVSSDEGSDAVLGTVQSKLRDGADIGDMEYKLLDWGVIFGMAFGIVRAEEPWLRPDQIAKVALEEAWPVFLEFSGTPGWTDDLGGERSK